ncbi:hypothetical protein BpHYR1_024766 [Brachionus plicatilis]|uniref:Uncharacterized protein n=1 Tax=Brachionus plicatilis TaxID=10195 RepID=A0A3M7SIB0_BRAPC|nr:hypothetical protein BpHYR1_024766 [Brachionus plicatilis]
MISLVKTNLKNTNPQAPEWFIFESFAKFKKEIINSFFSKMEFMSNKWNDRQMFNIFFTAKIANIKIKIQENDWKILYLSVSCIITIIVTNNSNLTTESEPKLPDDGNRKPLLF